MLVVDDDRHVRLMLKRMLGIADPRLVWVGEASDGEEALRRHAELRPGVVLLDLWMPGLDGLGVARTLRQQRSKARIVLFSAALDAKVRAAARELGIAAVVDKTDLSGLWSALSSAACD